MADTPGTFDVTSGFDEVAAGYDAVAESALGVALRRRVHAVLEPLVTSGRCVLDLGCGTGIDATWARGRGADVVACDASPRMVEIARTRLGTGHAVHVVDLAAPEALGEVVTDRPIDVVVSNFGALNCVEHLEPLGNVLGEVCSPEATFVAVTMSRVVPWEQLAAFRHLDRRRIRRRFRDGETADDGTGVAVWYRSAAETATALGDNWRLRSAEPLGVALPTYEQRHLVENHPTVLRALGAADRAIAGAARVLPSLSLGDHQIAVMERTEGATA